MDKFNIVIGTHGRFGEELVKSAEMIAGPMNNVVTCSLLPEYSFEEYLKVVDQTVSKLGGFVIALVDLYGGTPCNTFSVLSKKYNYQVLTGLNLPLLIDVYLKLSNLAGVDEQALIEESIKTVQQSCINTNAQLQI